MPEEQAPASQPTPGRDVFISYASHDKAVAESVCKALESAGVACWIAPRNVTPGAFYAESIVHAIDSTKVIVLVLSQNAADSQHVLSEVERARSRRHPVVSFRIDTAPLPAALEYFLNSSQWLDASGMGATRALPRLVDAVKIALAQSPAAARIDQVPVAATRANPHSRRVLVGLAVIVAAALAYYIADKFWLAKHAPAAQPMTAATKIVSDEPIAVSVKSLAVLPFENLSGLAGDADLADGLHEEILSALARLRDLKVISRTSVMEFRGKTHNVREIGQKLGVGSILEGSIRRDRGVLRLTVQLIDARTDRHLFAANYDRDPTRVLNLQSTVARQVADALAATLNGYERGEFDRVATNSGDAYDRYLRAVAKYKRPVPNDEYGLVEPIRLLEEALRFDPDYADALALLAQAHTNLYARLEHSEDRSKALQALDRALAIDPHLPEARLARGLYALYVSEDDPDQALTDLEAVVQLRPNSALAHQALGFALRRGGHVPEALPHFMRAWNLDPLNYDYVVWPVETLIGLRRFPEAIEQIKLWSKRFPDDVLAYLWRGHLEGLLQHSVEPLRAALRDHGNSLEPWDHKGTEAEIAVWEGRYFDAIRLVDKMPMPDEANEAAKAMIVGFWYWAAGDAHNAELKFRRSEQLGRAQVQLKPRDADILSRLALVESMLGEHKAALATIEKARTLVPEARDALNGPPVSFMRSVILVRAGYAAEGYAEATRLLRVPFGQPADLEADQPVWLVIKDDPKYDEILHHPPRL
jgi:TolB-like protein/regulator of sirC expression with transglutaminase-like and TPR domain